MFPGRSPGGQDMSSVFDNMLQASLLSSMLGARPATDDRSNIPLAEQHEETRRERARQEKRHGPSGVSSSIVPVGRFSRRPLASLSPIGLGDLLPGVVHAGKYVICRTLVTPYKLRAVFSVVQGLNGPQRRLSVYNMATDKVPGASSDVSAHCLPKGIVMAIKEPYYKKGAADNQYFIRVDTPMDVVVIDDPSHPVVAGTPWSELLTKAGARIQDHIERGSNAGSSNPGDATNQQQQQALVSEIMSNNEEGNKWFGLGHFPDALSSYQRGLELLESLLLPSTQDTAAQASPDDASAGAHGSAQQPQDTEKQEQLRRQRIHLLNNCAAACLGLQDYDHALTHACRVLDLEPVNPKALMRKSKALQGLGRFSEALTAWKDYMAAQPTAPSQPDAATQRHLQKLERFVQEGEYGVYDEAAMLREASASKTPRLTNHVDYIGPVQVVDLDGATTGATAASTPATSAPPYANTYASSHRRGRGLVTTAPVRAGQLLLACKADAISYIEEVQNAIPQFVGFGVMNCPTASQLNRDLVPMVLGCGRLTHRLAHLYDEKTRRVPPVPSAACGYASAAAAAGCGTAAGAAAGAGAVPTGALQNAVAKRGEEGQEEGAAEGRGVKEGCPDDWLAESGLVWTLSNGYFTVDENKLISISGTNVFTPDQLPTITSSQRESEEERFKREAGDAASASGLWSLAAYINHACAGNANRYFLGDYMFVRAIMDLPAGAEVTFSYVDVLRPVGDRRDFFRRRGFKCTCELCREDEECEREHPEKVREVQQLLQSYERMRGSIRSAPGRPGHCAALIPELRALLGRMDSALEGRQWRLPVFGPASGLAFVLQAAKDAKGAAAAYELAYHSLRRADGSGQQLPPQQQQQPQQPQLQQSCPYFISCLASQVALNVASMYAAAAAGGNREARRQAKSWEGTARRHWAVSYGSDKVFDMRFQDVLRTIM